MSQNMEQVEEQSIIRDKMKLVPQAEGLIGEEGKNNHSREIKRNVLIYKRLSPIHQHLT